MNIEHWALSLSKVLCCIANCNGDFAWSAWNIHRPWNFFVDILRMNRSNIIVMQHFKGSIPIGDHDSMVRCECVYHWHIGIKCDRSNNFKSHIRIIITCIFMHNTCVGISHTCCYCFSFLSCCLSMHFFSNSPVASSTLSSFCKNFFYCSIVSSFECIVSTLFNFMSMCASLFCRMHFTLFVWFGAVCFVCVLYATIEWKSECFEFGHSILSVKQWCSLFE